jgi:hypothetical protein
MAWRRLVLALVHLIWLCNLFNEPWISNQTSEFVRSTIMI